MKVRFLLLCVDEISCKHIADEKSVKERKNHSGT